MTGPRTTAEEATAVTSLVARILAECPQRKAGTADERRAQELVREALQDLGRADTHTFRFSDNLYAVLAAHFGVGVIGTVVGGFAPLLGGALRALAGGSYLLDSSRAGYLLRRLLPWRRSQNLLVTLPAREQRRLRIVFLAHTDAAFTGWLFDPRVIKAVGPGRLPPRLRFLGRSLAIATWAELLGAALAFTRALAGPAGWVLRPVELLLAFPALMAFALNAQVVLRNETVPGATDDLSGVAGLTLLARRLAARQRPDVELVFAFTGAEEAGTGGAFCLARDRRAEWDPADTVVIGLDGLSNGELCWLEEGEVVRTPVPSWLDGALRAAADDDRFRTVAPFEVPVGATDVYPFRRAGYDGVCLGCVDRSLGAPRNYHVPTDTLDNLDPADVVRCVDFADRLVDEVVTRRLG